MLVCAGLLPVEYWPHRAGSYPRRLWRFLRRVLNQIANELAQLGAIENRVFFRVYARLFNLDRGLQAGNYQLPANLSAAELLAFLSSGESRATCNSPARRRKHENSDGAAREGNRFEPPIFGPRGFSGRIGPAVAFAEGVFFPETYFVPQERRISACYSEPTMP